MEEKIIYEDKDLVVIEKPPKKNSDDFPKRIHRLDKDASGILLVAKNQKALEFFQKQFKERKVKKEYLVLVWGHLNQKEGQIKTLIGRDPKNKLKQKVYLPFEPKSENKREAITEYKILKRYKDYDLLKVRTLTGRKHQIRVHFCWLGHPIAGEKIYRFKNQKDPASLKRLFLHASCLKIKMPDGKTKIFRSELPSDLKKVLKNLEKV